MADKPSLPPHLGILIGVFAVSTASVIIRLSDAPALVIAAYRLVFATLILLPLFFMQHGIRELKSLSPKTRLILIGVGVVLAAHFGTWITSLKLTSVASSVILVNAAPIFVALLSHFYFKEGISKRSWTGAVAAFIGTAIISWADFGKGEVSLAGDLLALMGALMLSLYLLAGRRLRQRLGLLAYVTPVYAVSAVVLFLACIVAQIPLVPYDLKEILIFLTLAVVPMIFGHTVYNWALRYVKAPIIAVSLLGEPVGAIILAAVFLHEVPGYIVVSGGLLTLVGIYVTARG